MEPIVGLVTAMLIAVGVRIYLAYFHSDAKRHKPFEEWVASRPLVMAFRGSTDGSRRIYDELRARLGDGELYNRNGGYPWQHYIVVYEHRRIDDATIGVFVAGASLERGDRQVRPDVTDFLAKLGADLHDVIDEGWLHGQFHNVVELPTKTPRAKIGWLGRWSPEGRLDVTEMIGHPEWIAPESTKLATLKSPWA